VRHIHKFLLCDHTISLKNRAGILNFERGEESIYGIELIPGIELEPSLELRTLVFLPRESILQNLFLCPSKFKNTASDTYLRAYE
jgi:hypothetical protein